MTKKICLGLFLLVNVYASDIVIDKDTDMMWQDSSKIVEKNYNDAVKYCKNLSLGGYDNWKLPNIDELMSISDKSRNNPAIKKIFQNTKNSFYWSSSKYKGDSSDAWLVNFDFGSDHYFGMSDKLYVRCMR